MPQKLQLRDWAQMQQGHPGTVQMKALARKSVYGKPLGSDSADILSTRQSGTATTMYSLHSPLVPSPSRIHKNQARTNLDFLYSNSAPSIPSTPVAREQMSILPQEQ